MKRNLMVWVGGSLMLLSASSGFGQGHINFENYTSGGVLSGSVSSTINFGSLTNLTLWPNPNTWPEGSTPGGGLDTGNSFIWPNNPYISGSSPVTFSIVIWTNTISWYASPIIGSSGLVGGLMLPPIKLPSDGMPNTTTPPPEVTAQIESYLTQLSLLSNSRRGFKGHQRQPELSERKLERLLEDLLRDSTRRRGFNHRSFDRSHRWIQEQLILIEADRLTNGFPHADPPLSGIRIIAGLPPRDLTLSEIRIGETFSLVPEPTALSLFFVGGGLLVASARRRNRMS